MIETNKEVLEFLLKRVPKNSKLYKDFMEALDEL